MSALVVLPEVLPAEPLSRRAPVFDEHGKALSDFMVLFPGLAKKPRYLIEEAVHQIQSVCAQFHHVVVFAELNVQLSLLWVSVKPITGIRFQISESLRLAIPEARLISHI